MQEEPPQNCCPLCLRPIAEPANLHHLLPLSHGGKNTETVLLHKVCHDKIHSLLTEREIADHYNTIARLQAHPDMQKFIAWVNKQPPTFYDRNKSANRKRKR